MGKNNLDKRVSTEELYERILIKETLGYFGVWHETDIEDCVRIVEQLKPKECVAVETMSSSKKDTTLFQRRIKEYQNAGLNLNKGDAQFGYKMPLPKKDDKFYRELIIFRRR